MQNKNIFSSLTRIVPQFHLKLTQTKLFLFALTLIAVGFALGGLESGDDDEAIANKVISGYPLPRRRPGEWENCCNRSSGKQRRRQKEKSSSKNHRRVNKSHLKGVRPENSAKSVRFSGLTP